VAIEAEEAEKLEVDISMEESSHIHTSKCINSNLKASMATKDMGDTIYDNTQFGVLKVECRYYDDLDEQIN
jgi:hypothetical protein